LKHDENSAVLAGGRLKGIRCIGVQRVECLREKRWNRPRDCAAKHGGAEKFAARFEIQIIHKLAELKFRRAHHQAERVQNIKVIELALRIEIRAQRALMFRF
jgi:hypothetical protein